MQSKIHDCGQFIPADIAEGLRVIGPQNEAKQSRVWRVKYTDIDTMLACHPFFKHVTHVSACSRKEAVEKVQSRFSPPRYGKFSASPADGAKPEYPFD